MPQLSLSTETSIVAWAWQMVRNYDPNLHYSVFFCLYAVISSIMTAMGLLKDSETVSPARIDGVVYGSIE